MILLDTNVVSEAINPDPHPRVSRDTSAFHAAGLTVLDPWAVTS